MPPLPPVLSEELQNSRVPSLHGRSPASSLLRTRSPPSRRRSTSRVPRLYDRPGSTHFAAGRGGLLQLLDASDSPCRRSQPRRSVPAASARLRRPVLPSRNHRPLGLRGLDVSGSSRVHLRYGP